MLMSMKCELPSLLWIVACLGPCLAAAAACGPAAAAGPPARSFADDVAFLGLHTKILVLADERNQAQVAVAPAWQGRVMTSTAAGDAGSSYGWINREFIAVGEVDPHINVFGGEDRFWLGPEGGQFSIFFAKGAPFDLDHWFTPGPIDTEPFEVVRSTRDTAQFRHAFALDQLLRHGLQPPGGPHRAPPRGRAGLESTRRAGHIRHLDGRLRVGQRDHATPASTPWTADTGLLVDLDPRHVQSVAGDHDRGAHQRRDRSPSSASRERRLLRQRPAGSARREGRRGLLQRRRPVPQQDRRQPAAAVRRSWAATTRPTRC